MALGDILIVISLGLFVIVPVVIGVPQYMDIFKRCKKENCISETCKYRHYCRKWRFLLTKEGENELQELQKMIDREKERYNLGKK